MFRCVDEKLQERLENTNLPLLANTITTPSDGTFTDPTQFNDILMHTSHKIGKYFLSLANSNLIG